MDGTCLAGERSFQGGEGTRAEAGVGEDLVEVGWSAEVDSWVCFKEIVVGLKRECGNLYGGCILSLGRPG